MAKKISAADARQNLGMVMEEAVRYNTRFIIQKHRKDSVVLMSKMDYLRTVLKTNSHLQALQAEAKTKGLDTLTMREIDDIISESRQNVEASS